MKILSMTTLATLFISNAAFALESAPSVVTGGVGEDSTQAIEAVQSKYNTKLVFTGKGGFYLADVAVIIRDKSGREVISDLTDGPFLLTELEPGQYTVEANAEGFSKKRSIKVGNSLKTYGIEFPIVDDARVGQTAYFNHQ